MEFEVWAILRATSTTTVTGPQSTTCTMPAAKPTPTGWVQSASSGLTGREGRAVVYRYPPPPNRRDTAAGTDSVKSSTGWKASARAMRCSDRIKRQRGFTLIEVMTASMILSALIIAIGSGWVVADRETSGLITRQKAIFMADAEMERLTTLYGTTSFRKFRAGQHHRLYRDRCLSLHPADLSHQPVVLSVRQRRTTPSMRSATFTNAGSDFQVWINSNFISSLNRAYVWVDYDHNVVGRISWTTSNITPSPCTGADGCGCMILFGTFLAGTCQKLVLYLEYPYRMVSGNPVADSNLQTLTLSTIVGRHT